MAKKQIEIGGKFTVDTSEFANAVKKMKSELDKLYSGYDSSKMQQQMSARLTGMGLGGIPNTGGAKESYEQLKKADAERMKALKEYKTEYVKVMSDLQKLNMSDLQYAEKKAEFLKRQEETLENINQLSKERSMRELMDQAKTSYQGGGMGGLKSFTGGLSSGEMLRLGGSALGAVGGAMQVGGALYRDYSRAPVQTAIAQGAATRGLVGKELENVYSGRSGFENIFTSERQKALSKSQEAYKGGRTADLLGVGGMTVAAAGAGIGAFAGGPIGAGVLGGIGAAGAGLYNIATNQRSRDAALSFFSDRYKQRYEAGRAEDYAKDFRSTYEAEKEKDPLKKMAADEFEKNMMRNLLSQRSMGLTNNQFYGEGGFQSRVNAAGFNTDMGVNMSNSILSSGGGTGMARQAQFGLQMQRAGLTNASGILGSLSGSIQSPESTKQATIGIMSEAMRIGLDSTTFAEENRKFSQAAADVLGRSGATSQSDQDRIVQSLGQFLGERTNAGVTAAQGAYEQFQERGSALGGRRGVLRMAEASKSSILSKFSAEDRAELLGARPEDLREDSAFLKSYATQAGVKPQDIISELGNINKKTRFLVPGRANEAEKQASVVEKYMREKGISYSGLAEMSRKGELPEDVGTAYGMYQRQLSKENAGGARPQDLEAAAGERFAGINAVTGEKPMGTSGRETAKAQLESGGARIEDKFMAAAGKDAEVVRDNFNKMSSEMTRAAEQANNMTEAARKMSLALSDALKEASDKNSNAGLVQLFNNMFSNQQNQTQNQSNKPAK